MAENENPNPYGFDEKWLNEKIPFLKKSNWLYKFVCVCMGKSNKKLSYKEMYLLLYGLNRSKVGEKKAKEKAMYKILDIYKFHHSNQLPTGIY